MKRKWLLYGIVFPAAIFVTIVATNIITEINANRYFFKNYDTLVNLSQTGCGLTHNYLGLSKSQSDKVNSLIGSFNSENKQLVKIIRERKSELLKLILQPQYDHEAITKKLSEISTFQAELEAKRVKHLLEIKQILNARQQVRFSQFLKKAVCPWDKKLKI